MEVDSGTVEETCDPDCGGVEGSENVEVERENTHDREPKVKRKMKTPTQLEILEKTYSVEAYPSEALRAELSVKLDLSDRQLQMWFCHRRLKDRRPPKEKRPKKVASSSVIEACNSGIAPETAVHNAVGSNDYGSGLCLFDNMDMQNQHRLPRVVHKTGASVPRYEPPLAISEQRAIRHVEAQLREPLREDGPILGMEFDPLPPGAFGTPIVPSDLNKPAERPYSAQLYEKLDGKAIQGAPRALHEFQFLPEKPLMGNDQHDRFSSPHFYLPTIDFSSARVSLQTEGSFSHCNEQVPSGYIIGQMPIAKISGLAQQFRPDMHVSAAPREVDHVLTVAPVVTSGVESPRLIHSVTGMDIQLFSPERQIVRDPERSEKKRKTEEGKIAKEVESHEKKIRKELEKQNLLMKKREEQMRKEMERQIREQRKEEERLLREKHREEERHHREQRREMERREKFMRKEYIRAEKRKVKEDMRREKEAARLKAANERAAARRVAKESTELFEDERLELMELAAQSWNLPSFLSLDSQAFENLDSFKDKLMEFPPKTVPLKKPFQTQPWTDSDENVGNLLMVWKFLISFADVLGLWPFTLDEFMQAMHDFDSRLLGELHIALLRSIIKDIEDVARTSSSSVVANQTSSAIPSGGHPRIVEGAYAWGFDLLSWQRLLTPVTWPEVLRQFALSAGFGPKLKNSNARSEYFHDENEGDNCANNISNLRSGLAAENAFALMQERGFSRPRRSRHRLTPGTVKFAAFHVLSVEGSMGLSILDVAEKIQKSGLRDLTTSKTPEASISAALSRDTKLFERTAPSTYCVRSPYRKEPSDAEAILSAAREKVRLFLNGNTDDDVDKDEAERDADSESDIDPDVDNLVSSVNLTEASRSRETSIFEDGFKCSGSRTSTKLSVGKINFNGVKGVQHQRSMLSDECDSGEHWVQGLTEGEYGKLSVEERLDALVVLVGIANEGNTFRVALEERLEAANALKKQMWAEAQLDKRRTKEENLRFSSSQPRDSPLVIPIVQLIDLNDQLCDENFCSDQVTAKDHSVSDNLFEPSGYATEKSRSDLKTLIGHRADEVYTYRSLPLGQDRRHNRYWQFIVSPTCNDPGSGKIYVEMHNNSWKLIDSEEGFYGLLSSLDVRGVRESHLHSMLRNIETYFRDSVRRRLSHFDCGISKNEDTENMGKHKKLESWIWKECFNGNALAALKYGTLRRSQLLEICENCYFLVCPSFDWGCSCSDNTFDVFGQSKRECIEEFSAFSPNLSLPPRIKFLKAQLSTIEASIPSESFNIVWSEDVRRSFALKLLMASTAEELLQVITILECSIKRDVFCPNFLPTSELLSSSKSDYNHDSSTSEVVVLPWIPPTESAIGLRLLEIDSAVFYLPEKYSDIRTNDEIGFFSKYSSLCSSPAIIINDVEAQDGNLQQNSNLIDHTGPKRGRGRPRGSNRVRGGKLAGFPRKKRQLVQGINKKNPSLRGRLKRAYYVEESVKDTEEVRELIESVPNEAAENGASSSGRSEFDDVSKSVVVPVENADENDEESYVDYDKEYEDPRYYNDEYFNDVGNRTNEQEQERNLNGDEAYSPETSSSSSSSGYSY